MSPFIRLSLTLLTIVAVTVCPVHCWLSPAWASPDGAPCPASSCCCQERHGNSSGQHQPQPANQPRSGGGCCICDGAIVEAPVRLESADCLSSEFLPWHVFDLASCAAMVHSLSDRIELASQPAPAESRGFALRIVLRSLLV